MSLMPGVRLGPYYILSAIGAGGMGEVYRARDTRLDRDVAIKVLPDVFAADPERIARFQREAKTLASLNHPNIAGIYGLEDDGGIKALVLELVEGSTLADRISQGPIPIEEALAIARQTANALEAAHEHGIIHRDLKPANVKVKADGTVKVLDFGLAKALEASDAGRNLSSADRLSQSPTITSPAMTMAGVILGTAAYMAPEQAKGRAADKRSDIWAFGCVLYEMLAGRPPFEGNDVSEVLAGVITSDPAWDKLPAELAPSVRGILRSCLHKDPKQRVRDIGDVRLALDGAFDTPVDATTADARTLKIWQRPLPALMMTICLMTATGAVIWSLLPSLPSAPVSVQRLSINLPASAPYNPQGLRRGPGLAVSPDGTQLVYSAGTDGALQLYLRRFDQLDAYPLPGSEHGRYPFFSPDGEWIAFFSDGGKGAAQNRLQKLSLRGGPPQTLCDSPSPRGGSWGAEPLDAPATRQPARGWPQILPGGTAVLFTTRATGISRLEVLSLKTGESRVVVENGYYGRYVATGHLIYFTGTTLMSLPFDVERLEAKGSAAAIIIDGIQTDPIAGAANLAITPTGTLVYQPGSASEGTVTGFGRIVMVSRDGRATPVAGSRALEAWPRLSPNNSRVAFYSFGNPDDTRPGLAGNVDIFVLDLTRGTRDPITREGSAQFPVWTQDGSRIVFRSTRNRVGDLYSQRLDAPVSAEPLLTGEGRNFPDSWSPSGTMLAFHQLNAQTQRDIWMLPVGGTPTPFLATPFNEMAASFSPNGRWVAYVSDDSGQREVYVQPYPGPGPRIPISTDGGEGPVWSRNGGELFYFRPRTPASGQMMVVDVRTEAQFTASIPRPLFEGPYATQGFGTANYDVFRDGKRFVMIESPNQSSGTDTPLVVILNWDQELKRLVPTR